jgi:hypothetical protein
MDVWPYGDNLISCKNLELSVSYRMKGNEFYNENKFFMSLGCYNKSLCLAPEHEKSFCFANRSAVYMRVNEYQLCLDNIQLARINGYPVNKMKLLNDREVLCLKMLENHQANPDDDPWNFFKLSYPAHEQIPFIVNCLELRKDEKFGRHIITNQGSAEIQNSLVFVYEKFFF